MPKKPDWKFWCQMIDVALAEAVALSLDLVPPRDYEEMQALLDESPRYRDRLAIAASHMQAGRLPAVSLASDPYQSRVRLADFAAWAESIHRKIPQRLSKLIVMSDTAAKDDRYLGQRERDTLYAIIAALANELKIDVSKPNKAALAIASLTEENGVSVPERIINHHLSHIVEAIERRSK